MITQLQQYKTRSGHVKEYLVIVNSSPLSQDWLFCAHWGGGKGVEESPKGVHVVTPTTPLHPFLTSNSTPPNSVGIACFGRLAYGTTFLFVENFHHLRNSFWKKCFVAYSQINQNTFLKIIMFLHIVQASSQGIKGF
jgi:hypothetical protein